MISWESRDKKYKVVFEDNGKMTAYRYGEYWQNLTGDNLILSMLYEIESLNEMIDNTQSQIQIGL